MKERRKRIAVYCGNPIDYGIEFCKCGNTAVQWSEWEDHLWCDKCRLDFTPEHWGIFDGPISKNVCEMMGISFDRFHIEEKRVIPFESEEWHKSWNNGPNPISQREELKEKDV